MRQVLEVERAHRALEPDVQLGNFPFADCQQGHAMECELLVEARHVFLIARQAIEALCDDDVELLPPRVLQQRLVAGPQVRHPAHAMVLVAC